MEDKIRQQKMFKLYNLGAKGRFANVMTSLEQLSLMMMRIKKMGAGLRDERGEG